jgi:hypothetical protein
MAAVLRVVVQGSESATEVGDMALSRALSGVGFHQPILGAVSQGGAMSLKQKVIILIVLAMVAVFVVFFIDYCSSAGGGGMALATLLSMLTAEIVGLLHYSVLVFSPELDHARAHRNRKRGGGEFDPCP